MNSLFLAVMVLAAPVALGYDEIYDKIDVDKILADDGLFNSYIDCMLDKGPCDVEHSEAFKKPYEKEDELTNGSLVIHHTYLYHFLLELLPEVIATSCAKCTPIQKEHVKKTVKALSEKKPDKFVQFKEKYDPKGEYEKEFTAFVLGTN